MSYRFSMPRSFSACAAALFSQGDGVRLFVHQEIPGGVLPAVRLLDLFTPFQPGNDAIDAGVLVDGILGRARDDQGRSGFVDKDGVDLVDDGEVMAPLHHRLEVELHVVAQVVEAELVVGAVGHVGGVGGLALRVGHVVLNDADGQPQKAVDLTHPLGVASSQVVVDGDDMSSLALESVEVDRHRGDQRLALTGLHLGDHALMQDDAADELNVEGAHADRSDGGFAHHCEGGYKKVVEGCALFNLLAKLRGLGLQGLVGERLNLGF